MKDVNWDVKTTNDGRSATCCEEARLAVLMDIRDELKKLNGLLGCHNCIVIPQLLRDIKRNTTKRKYKRKASK